MKITTTSRHYDLTTTLKEYAESKVANLTTYLDNIVSAHLIFSLEKYRHFFEVTIHAAGRDFVAHETSDDMFASVDAVAEKLERQLSKHKGKRQNNKKVRRTRPEAAVVIPPEEPEGNGGASEENQVFPADPIEFPTMTMAEAVSKLAENGNSFSIFSNRVTKRLNVLYKREDGSIGVIEA